jgi:hypothetical protein
MSPLSTVRHLSRRLLRALLILGAVSPLGACIILPPWHGHHHHYYSQSGGAPMPAPHWDRSPPR